MTWSYPTIARSAWVVFSESSKPLLLTVHCSNYPPRGILIHPLEDAMLRETLNKYSDFQRSAG